MSVSQYRSKIDFELSSLVKFSAGLNKVFSAMSDAELSAYADRWLSLGEVSAMRDLMKRIQ